MSGSEFSSPGAGFASPPNRGRLSGGDSGGAALGATYPRPSAPAPHGGSPLPWGATHPDHDRGAAPGAGRDHYAAYRDLGALAERDATLRVAVDRALHATAAASPGKRLALGALGRGDGRDAKSATAEMRLRSELLSTAGPRGDQGGHHRGIGAWADFASLFRYLLEFEFDLEPGAPEHGRGDMLFADGAGSYCVVEAAVLPFGGDPHGVAESSVGMLRSAKRRQVQKRLAKAVMVLHKRLRDAGVKPLAVLGATLFNTAAAAPDGAPPSHNGAPPPPAELSWHGVGASGESDGALAIITTADTVALLQSVEVTRAEREEKFALRRAVAAAATANLRLEDDVITARAEAAQATARAAAAEASASAAGARHAGDLAAALGRERALAVAAQRDAGAIAEHREAVARLHAQLATAAADRRDAESIWGAEVTAARTMMTQEGEQRRAAVESAQAASAGRVRRVWLWAAVVALLLAIIVALLVGGGGWGRCEVIVPVPQSYPPPAQHGGAATWGRWLTATARHVMGSGEGVTRAAAAAPPLQRRPGGHWHRARVD